MVSTAPAVSVVRDRDAPRFLEPTFLLRRVRSLRSRTAPRKNLDQKHPLARPAASLAVGLLALSATAQRPPPRPHSDRFRDRTAPQKPSLPPEERSSSVLSFASLTRTPFARPSSTEARSRTAAADHAGFDRWQLQVVGHEGHATGFRCRCDALRSVTKVASSGVLPTRLRECGFMQLLAPTTATGGTERGGALGVRDEARTAGRRPRTAASRSHRERRGFRAVDVGCHSRNR